MESRSIHHELVLNATPEKVWEVLTEKDHVLRWYAAFCEGAYADTDWKEGSKALFLDPKGNGMAAVISESTPGVLLVITYTGLVAAGVEDYTSPAALQSVGGFERYQISEHNGSSRLEITAGGQMDDRIFQYMETSWKKAIAIIAEIAESA